MSGNAGVCRAFKSPGGCRFGNKCRFSHDASTGAGGESTPGRTSPQTPRSPLRTRGGTPGGAPGGGGHAPRNVCDFYWQTGKCNRGFDCTFQHNQKTANSIPTIGEPEDNEEDAPNKALDFFTAESLSEAAGVAKNTDHELKPADAHNMVKPFTRDGYEFSNPTQMLAFARILASINRRNKAWDSDSAQEFLDMVVRGNALDRISDILEYTNVSSRAGTGFTTLSFQIGYFPILEYVTSDLVLKTTLHHNINKVYAVINSTYPQIHATLRKCMQEMIDGKSWKDTTPGLPASRQGLLSGVAVFKALSILIMQFFSRFKRAIMDHPGMFELVADIVSWFDVWSMQVSSTPVRFDDPFASDSITLKLAIDQLRKEITQMQLMVSREHKITQNAKQPAKKQGLSREDKMKALLNRIQHTYDAPGNLRKEGPRHDNDHVNIADIRIAPTHDELMCPVPPYLPYTIPEAMHHCPPDSMERCLDIQFRLLREELTFPIRESLTCIYDDLSSIWKPTPANKRSLTILEQIQVKQGGMYRSQGRNSVMFNVYTNVMFAPLRAERNGFAIGMMLDAPPGAARDPSPTKREEYWKHAGSKKLTSGSLVALVLVRRGQFKVHLGTLVSSSDEVKESSKAFDNQIQVRAEFFDPEVELQALRGERISVDNNTFALLIDNNVMFESVRPFLKTLNTIEPTNIPFSRYIARNAGLKSIQVQPPQYATAPGFVYNLECLAKPREYIHPLRVSDPNSVVRARLQLKEHSQLDPSQCDSVVDALTREVSLIQGPPGTGKSFTGKELLRVLFANKIKPIVLIAYTNHALDHMLTSILDADITNKLVRLGSRSTDERIGEYSLTKLEKTDRSSALNRAVNREYAAKMDLEKRMKKVMEKIQIPDPTWPQVEEYLDVHYPNHLDSLTAPPFWISELARQSWEAEDLAAAQEIARGEGEWTEVQTKGTKKKPVDRQMARTYYGFWKSGFDIHFVSPPQIPQPPPQTGKKKKKAAVPVISNEFIQQIRIEYQQRMASFFLPLGFVNQVPPIPGGKRPTTDLLSEPRAWSMSLDERSRLAVLWEDEMRSISYQTHLDEYQRLRKEYDEACTRFNDVKDESRRRLLSQTDLIGCTTTGAAKLISLLTTISPRVLMVEESGQVLEAHILASLVPSIQHLICIGDPQQLRPTLATYALSMDSERGKELYKFDQSLMERLAEGGMPMSLINVQRRMRPTISHHIRTILYPNLKDHATVSEYPPVQGMEKDVYFFTHTNKEDGLGEESVSKVNSFEVKMIVDLVMHFLKQESYNSAGDIAVLCAYLGQLQQVRAALRSLKVAVSVDERDEDQMAKQGMLEEAAFEEVIVAKHVRLGTVDIFQGEEAKIVIVSLVRNSGNFDTESSSIGFLKSSNRINVALSRAKHGLYIMGNAANLRKNETWATIVEEMELKGQIGFGFPIVCPRHPEHRTIINAPGQLPKVAPGGGCLTPCDARLPCGHNCPSACHFDRDNHKSIRCYKPCPRLTCPRSHPCRLLCWQDCGNCPHPYYNVQLPCGHNAQKVECHEMDKLSSVKCNQKVLKKLPFCEHSTMMPCHQEPSSLVCQAVCDGAMSCCSKKCKSRCADCQKMNLDVTKKKRDGIIIRTQHNSHPCDRALYCQHLCNLPCSETHKCNTDCQSTCRQSCTHHQCPKPCSASCSPCMEPCPWICPHDACPVLCGSICSRLPCDEKCSHKLKCGHPCPSVCGEPCAKQKCITCLPKNKKTDIVDMIMQRTLAEIDLDSDDVSERLIALDCGHIFTVETLDGHCHVGDYYELDNMGSFLAPKAPPINYQTPPTCPTCRGPISALRYGRITKRANLDILEQNVASNMSKLLDDLSPNVIAINDQIQGWEESAKNLKVDLQTFKDASEFDELDAKRSDRLEKLDEPLSVNMLDQNAMKSYHGFAQAEAKEWHALVKELIRTYGKLTLVAKTRSAHVRAYEAALTTLYDLELKEMAEDPARATDRPEPIAIEAVRRKIGQPPHKADRRYHVEAFLLSVEVRFMLGQVARARVDSLTVTSNEPKALHHRHLWASFTDYIYESCISDCKKAISIADRSSASRQTARSAAMQLKAEFESFRFSMIDRRFELFKAGELFKYQQMLLDDIAAQKLEAMQFLAKVERSYLRSRPSKGLKDMVGERTWFDDNCGKKCRKVFEAYNELTDYITKGGLYQPMTLREREEIVKAFGFSHRGHFYNCENGHTFVITECGGAMETATCPECRAPIGGSDHNLTSSNSRATEFEEIAGRIGAENSPWAWARGA